MHDRTDLQIQAMAVAMWANYIETGDVSISARDAQNAKLSFKALTTEQSRTVLRFRDLSASLLRQDSQLNLGAKAGLSAPAPAAQTPSFQLVWSDDPQAVQSLKVGAIKFATISNAVVAKNTPRKFQATFLLKGIKPDQGLFDSIEMARAHLERAAKGWLKALEG
ncbi:hypothetical protein [Pseudomonas sp. Leaf58]|uniref:hypothetical protein n=1 Tax=Pseudomonas sp. Leaf58 TaxID=1736226 RepID=UPI000B239DD6|nr:hypothetical protein [Pseudomonas sp. Leaf58]